MAAFLLRGTSVTGISLGNWEATGAFFETSSSLGLESFTKRLAGYSRPF